VITPEAGIHHGVSGLVQALDLAGPAGVCHGHGQPRGTHDAGFALQLTPLQRGRARRPAGRRSNSCDGSARRTCCGQASATWLYMGAGAMKSRPLDPGRRRRRANGATASMSGFMGGTTRNISLRSRRVMRSLFDGFDFLSSSRRELLLGCAVMAVIFVLRMAFRRRCCGAVKLQLGFRPPRGL